MKKMIVAAVIVCAATFAHAAACTWSLGGITASPETELAKDAMTGFFMDGSTYEAFSALDSSKVAAFVTEKALSTAGLTVARGSGTSSNTFGDFKPETELSGYIVVFDNSSPDVATYFANTAVASATVPGAGNAKISLAFGANTAGWQKIGSVTPGPTPGGVPEPTSGLLLVLGGAALALRRRR